MKPWTWTLVLAAGLALSTPGSHAVALTAEPAGSTLTAQARVVPVLCYHRFQTYGAPHDLYFLTTRDFERQLEIIREEGFTPITAGQLLAGMEGTAALPAKLLVITIDDGYRDFITLGKPLLEKFGYPATLFVYTGFVNTQHGLSAQDLKDLEQAGYEIGSHTRTHPYMSRHQANETPAVREARLRDELQGSRDRLRQWSGGEVTSLGYPFGLWDRAVADLAQAAGYQLMFTVNPGPNTLTTPRFALKRFLIVNGTRENTFREFLRLQPLTLTRSTPAEGERVPGPLTRIEVTLAPELQDEIDPASLSAKRGEHPVTVQRLETKRSTDLAYALIFGPAWTQGTNLVTLTARGRDHHTSYQTSWLVIVDPAEPQKGK